MSERGVLLVLHDIGDAAGAILELTAGMTSSGSPRTVRCTTPSCTTSS